MITTTSSNSTSADEFYAAGAASVLSTLGEDSDNDKMTLDKIFPIDKSSGKETLVEKKVTSVVTN